MLLVLDLKTKVRMGCAIVYAMRHELMQMGILPPHYDLEHQVERGQTDVARDLDSAPDGGFTVPEGDFELVDGKVRRGFCSWHRCFPVRSKDAGCLTIVVHGRDVVGFPLTTGRHALPSVVGLLHSSTTCFP
jgi:hypothetical protein